MPRGDHAILNNVNEHLDGGAAARFLRSLRLPESAHAYLAKLNAWAAAHRKVVKMGGIGAAAGVFLLVISLLLWRAAARSPDNQDAPTLSPRHNTIKSGRASAAPGVAQSAEAGRSFSKEYKILVTRSIFSIGGVSSGGRSSSAALSPAGNIPSVANLTLKGILGEDARISAYVEDTASKTMLEVHVGDALGPGRVVELTPSELVYGVGGTTRRIQVGQLLDGTPAAVDPQATVRATAKPAHKRHHDSGG
jgi:hypothetical protein